MSDKKIKILFLDHTPFVGGAQLSLIQHIEEMDKNKFDISIACSPIAESIGLLDYYKKIGIKYFIIPFGRLKIINPIAIFRLMRSVLRVGEIIKKEKTDLLISFTVRAHIAGTIISFFHKTPLIWSIRDFTFSRFLFKFLSFIPEKIIFNSKATANFYKNKIENKDKIEIVYVGRNFYKKVENVKLEEIVNQREEWGVDKKTFVIGYVGRLVNWKGPQIIIRCIDLLAKEGNTNIKLIIVGTGKNQKESNEVDLKKLVKDLNLENFIIFTGHREELEVILPSLDVLALPSIEPEPFSSVVIDAMMAKVPVIGTNIGGTPEIIKDKITGILVKPGDANNLKEAIKELMDNKVLRNNMAEAAYENVMSNYTSCKVTYELENIYNEVINICKVCGSKKIKNLIKHLYYCYSCSVIFSDKHYKYKQEFFNDFFNKEFVRQRLEVFKDFFSCQFIKNLLGKDLKVLDIGCATGDFIYECGKITKWKLFGIEISGAASRYAKMKNQQSEIFTGTIEEYVGEGKEKFDLVFCSHILEHVDNPTLFINSINKILKVGGILYIEIPNERTDFWLWRENRFNINNIYNYYVNHKYGHLFFFSTKSIKKLLKDFKILSIYQKEYPYLFIYTTRRLFLKFKLFIKELVFKLLAMFHITSRIIIVSKKV